MRKKIIYGLLFSITLVFCFSMTPYAIAGPAEKGVLQVAINFTKAFNTRDFELMSSLWWQSPKTSSFGPAKGMAFLSQGWGTIGRGWQGRLKLPEGTFRRSLHNPQVTMLGDNVAIITQYAILTVNPPVTKEPTVNHNRQTFVVQKIEGKWLIVHGHASPLP